MCMSRTTARPVRSCLDGRRRRAPSGHSDGSRHGPSRRASSPLTVLIDSSTPVVFATDDDSDSRLARPGGGSLRLSYYRAATCEHFLLRKRRLSSLCSIDPAAGHVGLTLSSHPLGLLVLDAHPDDLRTPRASDPGVITNINGAW